MRIRLNEMVFYGYHGVFPEERKLGQRFVVSLEVETDPALDHNIRHLNDTVNYERVFTMVKHHMENQQFELLENCAVEILDHLFEEFSLIIGAEVSIRKPGVAINGSLESAEVIYQRRR